MSILRLTVTEQSSCLPRVVQLRFAVHHHRREAWREVVDAITVTARQVEIIGACRNIGNLKHQRRVGMI